MPNIKSAKKRVKVAKRNSLRNVAFKSEMRTSIKAVVALIAAGKAEEAQEKLKLVHKLIDQAIQKKMIHKNNGARKKARLAKKLNSLLNKSKK